MSEVILPDSSSLNKEVVFVGLARRYRKYATNNRTLKALETGARAARREPWAGKNPVPPWEWRKDELDHRLQKKQVSGLYHGNFKSHVFHRPGYRYYDRRDWAATLTSREEALNPGYRARNVCNL